MVPFPSALESSILFNEKEGQIDEMIELIETFQGAQMNNPIKKATPIILPQDSLDPYLTYFGIDDFDVDRYIIEINDLVDTSYPKIIPL